LFFKWESNNNFVSNAVGAMHTQHAVLYAEKRE
jgi:hypothetical protein